MRIRRVVGSLGVALVLVGETASANRLVAQVTDTAATRRSQDSAKLAERAESIKRAELAERAAADQLAAQNTAFAQQYAAREKCKSEGTNWKNKLEGHSAHFTEIVVGDPIYVGLLTPSPNTTWTEARFTPCALQSAVPTMLDSTSANGPNLSAPDKNPGKIQEFLSRRCFSRKLDVVLAGKKGETVLSQKYALAQYDRYRGTVQGGVLFTNLHDATFGLRPNPADTQKKLIYQKGVKNSGPEYIATTNVDAILNYLKSLGDSVPYQGRVGARGPPRGRRFDYHRLCGNGG